MENIKQIKVNEELHDIEDSKARSDIAAEVTNRTNADKALDDKVKAETEARTSAYNALNQKIVQETTNRTNADNALQEKINTNKNDISELKDDLVNNFEYTDILHYVDFSDYTDGYISGSTVKESTRFATTKPISVKKGCSVKVSVCGYVSPNGVSEVNIVSKYDRVNSKYFSLVNSDSNITKEYTYEFIEDCEIVICFDKKSTMQKQGILFDNLKNYSRSDTLLRKKEDMSHDFENGLISTSMTVWNGTSSEYKHIVISVSEGEEYLVSGSSNNKDYAGIFYRKNGVTTKTTIGGNNQVFKDVIITIPNDVDQLVVNGSNSLQSLSVYKQTMFTSEDVGCLLSSVNEVEQGLKDSAFEIRTLKERCLRLEKRNDFAWAFFDKAYFAFVIDDCNSFTPKAIRLFMANGIPLSSAVIVDTLDTIYAGESKSIKEHLIDMVNNGGEVLAHYSYNLYETSTDLEWYENVVVPKKVLIENGFVCDGVIRANSTTVGSNKGERYCREYFRYSDNLGKSTQYKSSRKFFMSFSTLQDIYNYIDKCCNTKGFFPFCMHGNRSDEPLATEENLQSIIDYIKSKGDSVADFTTYRDIYDEFGSTVLEERIKALENA